MTKKRKKLKIKPPAVALTLVFVGILAYGVYSGLDTSGMKEDEVYKLTDIAINVEVDKGYGSKVLTNSPVLIIHGDKKKVKKMKKAETIPEVTINMKRKKSGEYVGVPKVDGKLFNVQYTFQPAEIEVAVLDATEIKFLVNEREYGLTGEGMHVAKVLADTKANLLITAEQERSIGQVIAEVNVDGMLESAEVMATVLVLDKRGNIMPDIDRVTEEIPVYVEVEKLGWLQTEQDIANLEEEIATLVVELAEQKALDVGEQDVLKKADLRKEIDFREKRLITKKAEVVDKKSGLAELKELQESKKVKEEKKSLLDGGKVEDDEALEENKD